MKKRNAKLKVNLASIRHNIDVLRSRLEKDVKTMAVIKANAYGHGVIEVAKAIRSDVDWFAVNDETEGIELRQQGLKNPILVFGVPESKVAHLYKKYNLTATISAADHFDILPAGTTYHINFDSGMGRLGFHSQEINEVLRLMSNHSEELQCTGIYSHFATADELQTPKPAKQFELFKKIRNTFDSSITAHMCNTAGIIKYSNAHFDMVRMGIGLYGYAPGETQLAGLKPAAELHTRLVQVKSIEEGETVSYGANWQAQQDGYIGIIPVGYSDGIPRLLSGKMEVTIKGEIYPVVGTVTMNYCMVDLGKEMLETGTKVKLWDKTITAKSWANAIGTIPYEIVTGIRDHIPREYLSKDTN